MNVPWTVIVMGVSGSGKTEVGARLAHRLGTGFFEGDDFHQKASVKKMRGGAPLTDEDRLPWLAALNHSLREFLERGESVVLACSALKTAYRAILSDGIDPGHVCWVYLRADADILRARMEKRRDHFFPPGLLESQLATLEEPEDAFVVGIESRPEEIVEKIVARIEGSA